MATPKNIGVLIEKYFSGNATPEELNLLNEWYHSFDDENVVITSEEPVTEEQINEQIKRRLLHTTVPQKNTKQLKKHRILKWQFAAAAAVLLLITSGVYFSITSKIKKPVIAAQQKKPVQLINDIAPGGNKALLTLSNGSQIILDSAVNGTLTKQGNIKVVKLDNGLLAYSLDKNKISESNEALYNTISTPRGGQYQVTLADGTQVWLNAASSIRFPVVFNGKERKVEVKGEVYFEVVKNVHLPFKVITNNSEVEVLGTHFNINAYENEASVKTTLLEGSVKIVVVNQPPKYLQPGQQSVINKDGKIKVFNNADLDEVMAWKNGRFQFKSADLKSILRQIERWYDVDVEYHGNVNLHFTGQLTRSDYVSKVFEKLSLTGAVHFTIEGKKIIVSP